MARTVGPDLSSRGFQLNNPMNIEYRPQDKWQGRDEKNPHDNPPGGMTKLTRFVNPVYGIRAGARQLITYQDKHDCETVADHITRWAPPPKKAPKDKNHTAQYIKFVANALDVLPDDPINVHEYETLRPMIEAMIDFENKGTGHPYTDAQIDKALVLAGVEPPSDNKPIASTSAKVTGAGLGLTTVSAIAQQAQEIAEPVTDVASAFRSVLITLKPFAPYLIWVAIIVALVGLGTLVYRSYQNRKLGL
jgi:hypothetical protein